VASRTEAADAVRAGRVLVAGSVAEKASRLVGAGEPLTLAGEGPRFVSRGGEKLDAVLERCRVGVAGVTALDAGASTGGFTDCLLQRGAAQVHAVDVGHGQLDPRLRSDPRVVVHERCNIREVPLGALAGGPVDVVTADLSFISLLTVIPALTGPVLADGGTLVLLVKPQFEAGRPEAARGRGVIRDPEIWERTVSSVGFALEDHGTGIMGAMPSPLRGPAGNHEFFLVARRGAPLLGTGAVTRTVADAVAEVGAGDGEG
jgi:23S rRNA (cytidine1920-2'-O)/16S rRNA (cytidine1409-2'-O)-methyltransferase